ncbi:phage Gp37/Gp68 family protein, partial [Candidatus Bathyarchaeota archaeon]|nr:phage Gp37/Gp68 family protein [Candidatus Bathyarchaeota archaeon]
MEPEWATNIRDQSLDAGVPFFFKQWGGVNKKKNGRTLDGRTWNDMPLLTQEKFLVNTNE